MTQDSCRSRAVSGCVFNLYCVDVAVGSVNDSVHDGQCAERWYVGVSLKDDVRGRTG